MLNRLSEFLDQARAAYNWHMDGNEKAARDFALAAVIGLMGR